MKIVMAAALTLAVLLAVANVMLFVGAALRSGWGDDDEDGSD